MMRHSRFGYQLASWTRPVRERRKPTRNKGSQLPKMLRNLSHLLFLSSCYGGGYALVRDLGSPRDEMEHSFVAVKIGHVLWTDNECSCWFLINLSPTPPSFPPLLPFLPPSSSLDLWWLPSDFAHSNFSFMLHFPCPLNVITVPQNNMHGYNTNLGLGQALCAYESPFPVPLLILLAMIRLPLITSAARVAIGFAPATPSSNKATRFSSEKNVAASLTSNLLSPPLKTSRTANRAWTTPSYRLTATQRRKSTPAVPSFSAWSWDWFWLRSLQVSSRVLLIRRIGISGRC